MNRRHRRVSPIINAAGTRGRQSVLSGGSPGVRVVGLWITAFSVIAWIGLANGQASDDAEKLADTVKELVVVISGELDGAEISGAGIIVGSKADRLYIATANHVVRKGARDAQNLRVELKSLPGETFQALLQTHYDADLDLAVLRVSDVSRHKIPVETLSWDRLGSSTALKRGSPVYPVGNPKGLAWITPVTPDKIADVVGDQIHFESNFVREGHSGGGLFTERWELVGMILADQPPLSRALSMSRILKSLQQWNYPVSLVAAREAPPSARRSAQSQASEIAPPDAPPKIPSGSTEGGASNPAVPPGAALTPPRLATPNTAALPESSELAESERKINNGPRGSPTATGRLCPSAPDDDGVSLVVSGMGKRVTVRAGECIDLEAGSYHVGGDESGVECESRSSTIVAGQTQSVRVSCTVDLTGTWFDETNRSEYVVFQRVAASEYHATFHEEGMQVGTAVATVDGRVVRLRGTVLLPAYPFSGEFRVTVRQMRGDLVLLGQRHPTVLVR
jgi:hypothetical protein